MKNTRISLAIAAVLAAGSASADNSFVFDHLWTFNHATDTAGFAVGSEIVSFDSVNNHIWVAGSDANFLPPNQPAPSGVGGVDVLDLAGNLVGTIDTTLIGGTKFGGVNSVAVKNGLAAIAVTAPTKTDQGLVRFYNASTFTHQQDVTVGANPDSVTFNHDGSRLLVANEGEPLNYSTGLVGDPVGSVSIINTTTFANQTAGFGSFDSQAAALKTSGVRLNGPGATVSMDLEPEYIAVSSDNKTAFATLQEANSVAIIDIDTATVTGIKSLGMKDHSLAGNGLDVSDRDGAGTNPAPGNIQNWKVMGMYMPDGITSFVNKGSQYYVTANEGDSRADFGFVDEVRVGSATIDPLLNAELTAAHGADWKTNNDKLNRLTVSTSGDTDGDGDLDQLQVYGGRSFSILNANGDMVFDSGDQIEQIIKTLSASTPALWDDGRSDNKGPEPESAVVGKVNGRDLLFLGLERSNAVMVWDLTDLANIMYLNTLFTVGDTGPEGLSFFSNAQGSYLAVANEITGTTSLYSVASVPVPGAVWLFGSVLAGFGYANRRGKRSI